jgi:hypothetical protein
VDVYSRVAVLERERQAWFQDLQINKGEATLKLMIPLDRQNLSLMLSQWGDRQGGHFRVLQAHTQEEPVHLT